MATDRLNINNELFFPWATQSVGQFIGIYLISETISLMDDTSDKYCNYKTTDCTVTSTKDLYKALNFPKRFECPCKSNKSFAADLFNDIYCRHFRFILWIWNSAGAEKLHLQDNKLGLWVFHPIPLLRSRTVRHTLWIFMTLFSIFVRLISGITRWINSSPRSWHRPECIEIIPWTRASTSLSAVNINDTRDKSFSSIFPWNFAKLYMITTTDGTNNLTRKVYFCLCHFTLSW